jgi:hypothetical protein
MRKLCAFISLFVIQGAQKFFTVIIDHAMVGTATAKIPRKWVSNQIARQVGFESIKPISTEDKLS